MQKTRRMPDPSQLGANPAIGVMSNGLTGTPMYMSPEMIKNDRRGRQGATDIWSLGCVVLQCATGKKPWSNLDNEWCVLFILTSIPTIPEQFYRAIMFHIGVSTQHPPLPEPGQLSPVGIDFIKQCLTIDPILRPTAQELTMHPWMVDIRAAVESIGDEAEAEADGAEPPTGPLDLSDADMAGFTPAAF